MGASEHLTRPAPSSPPDDDAAYRRFERQVTARLSARFPQFDDDELLGLYHDAWTTVLRRRAEGVAIAHLGAYLHATAENLGSKKAFGADARRRFTWDPASTAFTALADTDEPPDERAVAVDEARRLRLLVAELGPSEQAVLKLRIDAGLEPVEVRAQLGLSERQYRRTAERAGKALAAQFRAFDRGDWARGKRSLLCACVMGIASAAQRERARALVADDPCCRAMMSELRRAGSGAAALVPWPAATAAGAPVHAHLGEQVADLVGAARERTADLVALVRHPHGGDARPRISETLAGARRQAGELVAGAKQHATGAYVRIADPTPLAGARPGAVGAVVASCLAVGGGVTYCATESVNPLRALAGAHTTQADKPVPTRKTAPKATAPRPAQVPPVTTPTPTPPPATTPQQPLPPAASTPPATPPTPPPSSASEFDPGAGSAQKAPSTSTPSTPAPASGGEFSGP